MSDLLTDARETLTDISSRRPGRTHYEGCRTEHVECLLADLLEEIELLRGYRDEAESEAAIASLAVQRLRLTDAEREAVALMAEVAADPRGGAVLSGYEVAATLRGLLERTAL